MPETTFNPFYERLADRFGLGVVGKILLAASLGLVFYLPYFSLVGSAALHDWSWLLALLISMALLFLYFATATLRNLFPVWTAHLQDGQAELFIVPLNRFLSDRNFFLSAFVVG